MPRLLACSQCHRHVEARAHACPFCGFGPLRCEAPGPRRWILQLSLAGFVGGGFLTACDKGADEIPKREGPKDATKTPKKDGKAAVDGGADQGKPEAKPAEDGAVVPEKTIYGGPREMEGEEPKPPTTPSPTPDTSDKGEGSEVTEKPEKRKDKPARKYGGARRPKPNLDEDPLG